MAVRVDESLDGMDWTQAKADLAADDFDNGRSPHALRASFERSQHVAIARDGDRVVGMARLLSDGVCNAYLLDVWTMSAYRRQGIGTVMVRQLMSRVPGQHIGLQTGDAEAFYASLGYRRQPVFMSAVAGEWLASEADARLPAGWGKVSRAGRTSAATAPEGAQIRRAEVQRGQDVAEAAGQRGQRGDRVRDRAGAAAGAISGNAATAGPRHLSYIIWPGQDDHAPLGRDGLQDRPAWPIRVARAGRRAPQSSGHGEVPS
jgi:GNAT superfamily N-acetyltransferase